MEKRDRNNTVLIVAAAAAGCLILLCVAAFLFIFLFGGVSIPAGEAPPIETTTLSDAQLEQCRELMAIQPNAEIEGEYYLYTPGFLDDSMVCHLRARAESLDNVFDLSIVDPSQTTDQEIAPGRFLRLSIEIIEPDLYRIEGFWFQT